MKKPSLLIAVIFLLAACGSGDGNPEATTSSGTQQSGGTPQADSFTANVAAIVSASSDTAEPTPVDTSAASSPENTEPSPVN
jgi:membrane-bound lytic murein transglycosylase